MTALAAPECVYIGDDFTGASDTLATYGRAGWKSKLFLGPPTLYDMDGLNAVGIATALRSMRPDQMREELQRIMPALAASRARYFHYKTCSTFDSSPDIGSIGAAVTEIAAHLHPAIVLFLGGQPSLGRYCSFGNLFARASDGNVHRIDRHPVMARHPVTPMNESDLRLHLEQQGLNEISLISEVDLEQETPAIIERLSASAASGKCYFLFDAVCQDHVAALGKIIRGLPVTQPILLVGASGVAEALIGPNDQTETTGDVRTTQTPGLPTLIFAGSRSSVTQSQVLAATRFHRLALTPRAISEPGQMKSIIDEGRRHLSNGDNLLAHLQPAEDYKIAPEELAQRSAQFVAAIAEGLELAGLGIAGGDTSSFAIKHLGIQSLTYLEDGDRGVAICCAETPDKHLTLMLKGGQMGGNDLFDRFALMPTAKR